MWMSLFLIKILNFTIGKSGRYKNTYIFLIITQKSLS